MAVRSASFRKIKVTIGDTIADRPSTAEVPAPAIFLDLETGVGWLLCQTSGGKAWQRMASGNIEAEASGSVALVAGTATVTPGCVVAAGSRIVVIPYGIGSGYAIGRLQVVSQVNGAAGVGTFTVESRGAAAGAVVGTDVSTFTWMVFNA